MKRLIALALVTVGIATSARAQWIVFDPTMNVQSILNTAQEIAKYVEMIENQVQQIETLTDQLNEFKHYEELFGDPKSVLLSTVQPLVSDLRQTELGQTLTTLEGAVDAGQAMVYDANGLFSSIGTTFTTPNGATVTRREAPYLPVAAVQKTTDNFLSVSTDATARRIALKEEIARTTTALKNATTDAEVQGLTGVLIGLSSALNQWAGLQLFLQDGRLEIDNNLVENAIRPTAVGKKNWLFIGAAEAGQRSAVLFTIIENCRRLGINPYEYLKDVLTRLPTMTNQQTHTVTPTAWAREQAQIKLAALKLAS